MTTPMVRGSIRCPEPECDEMVEVGSDAGTPVGAVSERVYECPKGHRFRVRRGEAQFTALPEID